MADSKFVLSIHAKITDTELSGDSFHRSKKKLLAWQFLHFNKRRDRVRVHCRKSCDFIKSHIDLIHVRPILSGMLTGFIT